MEKELLKTDYHSENNPLKLSPLQDGISSAELLRVSGSDLDIVNAARVSYGKVSQQLSDRDIQLLKYLIEHRHTSPLEHNQLSFRIKAPIFVARQWMRHRMNSYNEISYRFVKAPLEFYIPKTWRRQDTVNKQSSVGSFENELVLAHYKEALQKAQENYQFMLDQGVCREQARGVLPVCTYTEFIYTCNLHSLFNFLKLRLEPGAQYEIRCYAQALARLAEPHFPASFKIWRQINMAHLESNAWGVDFINNLSNTDGK